jgi:predicted transcriptional regulator
MVTTKQMTDRNPRVDAALAEGLADARAGRLSPTFGSMKAYQGLAQDGGRQEVPRRHCRILGDRDFATSG